MHERCCFLLSQGAARAAAGLCGAGLTAADTDPAALEAGSRHPGVLPGEQGYPELPDCLCLGLCALSLQEWEKEWVLGVDGDQVPRVLLGLPWWPSGEESACQCRRYRFDPWVGKIPWRREWLPTPVSLPGEFRGQRSLADYYSPRSGKESDMTGSLNNTNEALFTAFLLSPHHPPKPWYFLFLTAASAMQTGHPSYYFLTVFFLHSCLWSLLGPDLTSMTIPGRKQWRQRMMYLFPRLDGTKGHCSNFLLGKSHIWYW